MAMSKKERRKMEALEAEVYVLRQLYNGQAEWYVRAVYAWQADIFRAYADVNTNYPEAKEIALRHGDLFSRGSK